MSVETMIDKNTDKTDLFVSFWLNYRKKVSKPSAIRAFKRLKTSDQQKAIADCIKRYVNTDKQYIPHPATYLNNHMFNDPREGDEVSDKQKADVRMCEKEGCNEPSHGANYSHCINHLKPPETPVTEAMRSHYKEAGMVKREDETAHEHSKRLRKMFTHSMNTVLDVMEEFK